MIGIGGARPAAVAGSGSNSVGGSGLIGAALIKRTADTYCASSAYVNALRNCVFEKVAGDSGTIDFATGVITPPAGAKFVKIVLGQFCEGNTRAIYTRLRTDLDIASGFAFGKSFLKHGAPSLSLKSTSVYDIEGAADVEFLIYFVGGAFTFDGDNETTDQIGAVEFYG